jgi:hypothetical protein
MDDDDGEDRARKAIEDLYTAGKTMPNGFVLLDGGRPWSSDQGPKKPSAFTLRPARLPDPTTIQPRAWLYGTQVIRGFVTMIVAPGGTGKSTYAIAAGMALATGRDILGDRVFERVNVAVINLEDPMEELERRVAALMSRHNIQRAELDGRLFLNGCEEGLKVAVLEGNGITVTEPDSDKLIAEIRANAIGVLICDPFAESHTLEENSNPHMVQALSIWRKIARETNCAVILIHHVRKGEVISIDAARGGKGMTDSARVGLLLVPMSAAEAEQFGIAEEDCWQYVRLDDAKRNMAPASAAKWFKLESVSLGNTNVNERYPSGDNVQAIVPFKPQTVWQRTTPHDLNIALDRIALGPAPGALFAPDKRGGAKDWVGDVLIRVLDVSDASAKEMIAMWLHTGTLVKRDWHDKRAGKDRIGVAVVDTLRPDK